MKTIKYFAGLLFVVLIFASCEQQNIPKNIVVSDAWAAMNEFEPGLPPPPVENLDSLADVYAPLREWKKTDKKIAFGWFGGWTASTKDITRYLRHLPDSMDLVSIWSEPYNLTPSQIADKEFVQKIKGTKVTFTFIILDPGDGMKDYTKKTYTETDESIAEYARDIADLVYKYDYDGFDIDYEPNYAQVAKHKMFFKHQPNMTKFVKEIGKYMGPRKDEVLLKSIYGEDVKLDKILIIDGEPDILEAPMGAYFDLYISQAYSKKSAPTSTANLQGRMNKMMYLDGFDSKKVIFTEDFEQFGQTGGALVDFMAGFHPNNPGAKVSRIGGCGIYRVEIDGANDPAYKYIRQAILKMHPAATE